MIPSAKASLCYSTSGLGAGLKTSHKALGKPATQWVDKADATVVCARGTFGPVLEQRQHKQLVQPRRIPMLCKKGEHVSHNSVELGVLGSTRKVGWEGRDTRCAVAGHRSKRICNLVHCEGGDVHSS